MNKKGVLIVISGPSGAGKGTICKALLENDKDLFLSISATTRDPRQGEAEGINYYYLTRDEFKEKIQKGDFLEWAEVYGNFYGTPKSKVEDMLNSGKNVILEIDIQGALRVKENSKDGVFIFILPPSMEELKNRITNRGTETPEALVERFNSAYKEINYISKYNYGVVNDTVDEAVKKVQNIILAEQCRVDRLNLNMFDIKED
jgi:guanylate kinase